VTVDLRTQAHSTYTERSGTASTICRHLGFAAIALIWAFRASSGEGHALRQELVRPALLVVAALSMDLLQYVVSAALWGGYGRFLEWRAHFGHEIPSDAPAWINWPGNLLYWGKLGLMIAAYWFLLCFLRAEVLQLGAT